MPPRWKQCVAVLVQAAKSIANAPANLAMGQRAQTGGLVPALPFASIAAAIAALETASRALKQRCPQPSLLRA
jgi:hypothetical protein